MAGTKLLIASTAMDAAMAKKQKKDEALRRQTAVRLKPDFLARLESLADRFGLDVSSFIRLVLMEKVSEYEARAKRMEEGESN